MKRTLALLLLLAGCSTPESPDVVAKNRATLSGKGQHIGTLPDGRDITRYDIDRGGGPDHFIYVVGASSTVIHQDGKQFGTEVVIDGILYRKAEKE